MFPPNFLRPFAKWVTATSLLLQTAISLAKVLAKNAIVIRADGHSTTDILDAVLSLIPLDTYTEKPVALMEVVKGDNTPTPAIWAEYDKLLNKYEPEHHDIEMTERFAFYERAKKAYLIIATGETAIYANVLLKKGVVKV